MTEDFDLELSAIWDRVDDPTPAADGTVPERDDFYYFFGISYEL